MNTQNSRSNELLNKVYDRLDGIELEKLSLLELTDFLEVVQKGRFLETSGQGFPYGFGGLSYCATPFNGPGKPAETSGDGADKAE